jgi:predicted ATPase
MLLVLDNFEHLLRESDLLVDILETAPGVKLMVTSQERLNLQAEWVLEVSGMRVPEEDEREGLEEYSSVRLFIQNAQRAQADFSLTEEDKPYIVRICRLVGGMPLGIQLASAWVRLLSCQEIVREIEHNLDFLATSLRDLPERHRSLRVVFDHSWSLLSDEERRVYRQLSVFHGGFRRPAAEAVARASLSVLSTLVDKSFLHRHSSGWYEIHEVLRQYAAEKLHECPPEEEETHTRHGEYYATFLEPKLNSLKGSKQREAAMEIGEEIENLRASWRWAIEHGRIDIIEKSSESLYRFYEMRGWVAEGEAAFERAVEGLTRLKQKTAGPPPNPLELTLAKVMSREGALCSRLGLSGKAHQLLQRSLVIFRRVEDGEQIAFTLNYLGTLARLRGDYTEARHLWQESLAIFRHLGDRWGVAWTLNFWGHMVGEQGDHLEAKQMLQESLTIHQELGNQRGMAGALNSLGYVMYLLGEYMEARSLLQKSLVIRREVGYRRGIAISLSYLGQVAEALNELQESRKYFQEALRLAVEIRDVPLALSILVGLATSLAKEGQPQESLELLYFPLHHPGTGQEARNKAQQLFNHLEAQLPTEAIMISQATVGGEPQQFEETISRYLREH